MADALRITVDELKRRMEAGEDFTLIDVRNPRGGLPSRCHGKIEAINRQGIQGFFAMPHQR